MKGIERTCANVCISSLVGAYRQLLQMKFGEAVTNSRYGKSDTVGFDANVESCIKRDLFEFSGEEIVLITEETDDVTSQVWPIDPDPKQQPKMVFCDPVDRSKYLKQILEKMAYLVYPGESDTAVEKRNDTKLLELLLNPEIVKYWEKEIDAPASITGATSAITYVNRGEAIFSVILNFITRELFVACDIGIRRIKIAKDFRNVSGVDPLDHIMRKGKEITFPSSSEKSPLNGNDLSTFVTFLGKDMYREIFEASQIVSGKYKELIYNDRPGGPSRLLYHSNLQPKEFPIGFVLANGEKIGEWMHWLPFVKFAKNFNGNGALKVYEVSLQNAVFKDDILVSTPTAYSIFNPRSNDEKQGYLDVSVMKRHLRPSRFRSMLMVTTSDNPRMGSIMDRFNYRDVSNYF